jgi:hypothetical protein
MSNSITAVIWLLTFLLCLGIASRQHLVSLVGVVADSMSAGCNVESSRPSLGTMISPLTATHLEELWPLWCPLMAIGLDL